MRFIKQMARSCFRPAKQVRAISALEVSLAHWIPHSLHNSNFSVAVPTVDDMDPDTNPTAEEQDSMRAFCGMCRLTLILE